MVRIFKQKSGRKRVGAWLIVLLAFSFIGCSTTIKPQLRQPIPTVLTPQPPQFQKPRAFNVLNKVDTWVIVDHVILDYTSKLGRLRKVGLFLYNNELVEKLKSDKHSDYYWLMKLRPIKSGTFESRAIPYLEGDLDIYPLPSPPKNFSLALKIVNGIIEDQFIEDYREGWGRFNFRKIANGVLYMENKWYGGKIWAGNLPLSDGDWTVHMVLIK